MEVHIQKCQNCGSRDMRNVLVRDEQQKVFAQCRLCDKLVARYILSNGGYYHAGKEFESFLRSIERDGGESSAKDLNTYFEETKSLCDAEFADVVKRLRARYMDGVP